LPNDPWSAARTPFHFPIGSKQAKASRGEIIVADTDNSRVVRIADNVLPKNLVFLPILRR